MGDFESVAGIRGARLADLEQHVSDVLKLALSEDEAFQTGKLVLESFEFAPYALSGLSSAMRTPASGVRPQTHVTVPIHDDKGGSDAAEQDVTIYGPGDVMGVDPGQVVRRYPTPGTPNAEETFHAHIEFDRPELPWAFSAQTPGDRLRPWLMLVVLAKEEVEFEPPRSGLAPVAVTTAGCLPDPEQAWAWAHAQAPSTISGNGGVSGNGGGASLSARLSTGYAPVNLSRLVASRVLTEHTDYVACVVPTTDVGRQAGLGLSGGTLGPAWATADPDAVVRLPVHDRWEFRTGPDGDFARLARRLQGVAAPWEIGRRTLDTSRPGAPMADVTISTAERRQTIKGALYSPAPPPNADAAARDAARWSDEHTERLRSELESAARIEGAAENDGGAAAVPDLPIVGPRVYAKAQRGQPAVASTVPMTDWFAALNVEPVNRVVAGIGNRVVARDQEQLMQAAWAQVGEITRANREIAQAQMARHLAESLHTRMRKLEYGRMLQVTRPLAPRVHVDGATLTLAGQTSRSATPPAALSGSFRRATRPTGPVTRRLDDGAKAAVANMVGTADRPRDFCMPVPQVDGVTGLSATAMQSLDRDAMAACWGTTPDAAMQRLDAAATMISNSRTLATTITEPATWQAPDGSYSPVERLQDRLKGMLADAIEAGGGPGADPVLDRAVGGLAAGLAMSGGPGAAAMKPMALRLEQSVMALAGRVRARGIREHRGAGIERGSQIVDIGSAWRVVRLQDETAGSDAIRMASGLPGAVALEGSTTGAVDVRGTGAAARPVLGGVVPVGPNLGGIAVRPDLGADVDRPIVRPIGGVTVQLTEAERLEQFTTAQGAQLGVWMQQAQGTTVTKIRDKVGALVDAGGALTLAPTPPRPDLGVTASGIIARLKPSRTVVDSIKGRMNRPGWLPADWFDDGLIRPIMAAPRFDRPMYQALDSYDRDWLIPGLGKLPEDDMVTLLSMNDEFTEAFLVGLSDEMGRELLWREYPTDARGTYFHRFWNPATDELTRQIHRFTKGPLGSHVSMGPMATSGRAVVVIRSELVRRYPDLTVLAVKQNRDAGGNLMHDDQGRPLLSEKPTPGADAADVLFTAFLSPDILLTGLDITIAELRTPGWWILVGEHPSATRFRRKDPDGATFASPGGSATSAVLAADRLEHPTRVAFEATDLLIP